jgi:hypothetical protein
VTRGKARSVLLKIVVKGAVSDGAEPGLPRNRDKAAPQLALAEVAAVATVCDVPGVVNFVGRDLAKRNIERACALHGALAEFAGNRVARAKHCEHVRAAKHVTRGDGEERRVHAAAERNEHGPARVEPPHQSGTRIRERVFVGTGHCVQAIGHRAEREPASAG